MRLLQKSIQFIPALFLLTAVNAFADSWSCSHDNLVREVVIESPEDSPLPCTVVYKKQTEGVEDQRLWSADNQEGYCEEKAKELVTRLESWGWVCMETVGSQGGDTM
jgi:hypothetical protein